MKLFPSLRKFLTAALSQEGEGTQTRLRLDRLLTRPPFRLAETAGL